MAFQMIEINQFFLEETPNNPHNTSTNHESTQRHRIHDDLASAARQYANDDLVWLLAHVLSSAGQTENSEELQIHRHY